MAVQMDSSYSVLDREAGAGRRLGVERRGGAARGSPRPESFGFGGGGGEGGLLLPMRISRENSFLQMRDRSKSMEGGMLKPAAITRQHQQQQQEQLPHHLQHEPSVLSSKFHPPWDPSSSLAKRLNRIRIWMKAHENKYWINVKRRAKKIVESSVFNLFMSVVVLGHAVMLGFYQPEAIRDVRPINERVSRIAIGFLLVYVLEAVLYMVAYGVFLTPKKSYLRNPVLILDLVVITFLILYLSLRPHSPEWAEFFSSLATLKLIKILTISKSVKFMLKALAKSVIPLFYLSILTLIFILFFSLIGIELFQGRLHGGCFSNYTTPAGVHRSVLVSNFPCNLNTTSTAIIGDHTCPMHSQCLFWEEGPFEGIVSFDDIYRSFMLVFQTITLEGWSGVFFLIESSVGHAYAWVYFFFVIVLGSVLILNLWTGVLTIVFVDVSEKEQEQGNSRRLKEEQRMKKDLAQYDTWLRRGAELHHPSDTASIDRFAGGNFHFMGDSYAHTEKEMEYLEEEKAEVERLEAEEDQKHCWCYAVSSKAVYAVVSHKLWFWGNILAHVVNLALLMSLHFPSNPTFDNIIYTLNYVFSFIYVTNLLLHIYATGPIKFFTEEDDDYSFSYTVAPKVGEVLLAVLSVIALLVFIPIPNLRDFQLPVLLNALWCIKIMLIGKISDKNWEQIHEVLKTLVSLIKVILSLMALIGLFLYLYTILGLRLFGNRLNVKGFVQPNFDDIQNSFYLVFQLLTTEDWHNVYYSTVSAFVVQNGRVGIITSVYFLIAIVMGAFILVNAFLALSVDKLSEIRDLEEDQCKEKESEEKERKEREEQITALKNPKMFIRRRTIRRLLRFQAHNPAERAQAVSNHHRSWWRQVSLPSIRRPQSAVMEYHRSTSTPHESVSSRTDLQGPRKLSMIEEEGAVMGVKKRPNPLSFVDKQEEEDSFKTSTTTSAHMAGNPRRRSQSPVLEDLGDDDSVFKMRQASVMSEPAGDRQAMFVVTSERSHSLPTGNGRKQNIPAVPHSIPESEESSSIPDVDSTSLSVRTRSRLSRQDSIHDTGSPVLSQPSSLALPNSTLPQQPSSPTEGLTQDFTQRFTRGSSLEPIHQPIVRHVTASASRRTTSDKLKEKVLTALYWMKDYFGTIHFDPKKELIGIPQHSSFFIFDHNSSFRKVCFRVVKSKTFQTVSYAIILLSSIVLMLEVPNGVREGTDPEFCAVQRIIIWVDIVLLLFFIVEMALKMIALGVIVHRDSYMRSFFHFMDFVVTVLTFIPIAYYLVRYENREMRVCISYGYDAAVLPLGIGSLRVFRVLRPLRAMRIGGLYLAVTGLFSSLKAMSSIFFLDGLVLVIFAVLGVHYFRGSFFFCTDPVVETEDMCVGYYFNYDYTFGLSNLTVPGLPCPIALQRVWTQPGLNFDHVGNATLSLFTMLTAEGWQNVMYSGVNSRKPNDSRTPLASILENNRPAAFYYILYMIVMTFILLQLLVGFVIVTFQEVGVKTHRKTKLDRNQRNCLHFALTARPLQQKKPKYEVQERMRKKVLPWIDGVVVRGVIVLVLLFNTIVLCTQTYNGGRQDVIYYLNAVCTVFFAVEAIVKLVILTPPIYFRDLWNSFSFVIAVASVIELIVQRSHLVDSDMLQYTHIASAFRVLRLLEFIPKIKRILWTVLRSLEIFPWIGYLLIIIIYIYSIIGMHVFGTIAPVSVDESEENGIHEYNNFASFPGAVLLMLRVITGENWQDVMINCVGGQPCSNSTGLARDNSTCGSNFSYFFFPSFYLISTIMILNLFVAIIIDNFEYIVWDRSQMGAYNLGVFIKLWAKYDHLGDGKLRPEKVFDLLRKINPPVGWGKLCPRIAAYKKMMRMNIPIQQEKVDGVDVKVVTFNATLFAIVRTALDIHCKGCADCKRKCNEELREKLVTLFPNTPQSRFDEVLARETDETVAEEYAALLVQAEWRSFTLRRRRIVDIFQGSERRLLVHREVQDPGPDLITGRPLSTFHHDLEVLDIPPNIRKASESSRSSLGSSLSPRGNTRSPVYSPMPLLDPSGVEFLMEHSPRHRYGFSPSPTSPTGLQEFQMVASSENEKKSDGDDSSFASAHSHPFPSQESLHHAESTV